MARGTALCRAWMLLQIIWTCRGMVSLLPVKLFRRKHEEQINILRTTYNRLTYLLTVEVVGVGHEEDPAEEKDD